MIRDHTDLMLCHCLEECGLNLRWCSVDFVSEYQIVEDWALLEAERPVFGSENLCASYIAWQ
jgi:hypothetical protein